MPSTWAITGRAEEIEQVVGLLLGPGAGVLLVGEAGVGKTRLAEAVAAEIERRGHHVARVGGLAATADLPLAAVAPILPTDIVDSGLPALLGFRRALQEQGAGRPVLLVVDDAHLLDEASAALVHQVAGAGDARVLLTQRSGTAAPDVVARLWWDGLVARVEVDPLDRAHTAALAERIGQRRLSAEAAERIWTSSAGNPLFVRELTLAGIDGPDAPSPDTPASSRAGDALHTVSGLDRLVGLRLDRLGDTAREALTLIAFGEPLGEGEMEEVDGEPLVELERAGLVTAEEQDRRLVVRMAHPFYGEVLRAAAPADQRREIMHRLAVGLQATGARRRGDRVRLAAWAVESGLDVGPEVLVAGAKVARFSDDLELAETIGREAFSRHRDFAVGELLADVLYQSGAGEATIEHCREWITLADHADQRALVRITEAVTRYWYEGDMDEAMASLDLIEPVVEAPALADASDQVAESRGVRATLLAFAGRPIEALDLATPLVQGPPGRAHIQGALAASQALRTLLRPTEALVILEEAGAVYAALGEPGLLIGERELGAARVANLVDAGRFAAAESLAEELVDSFAARGERSRTGHMLLSEGWLRLQQGRTAAAVEALDTSARAFAELGHWGMRRWSVATSALAHAQRGDAAEARRCLADVAVDDRHPAKVFDQSVHRATAWAEWLEGDSAAARRTLLEGADRLAATGDLAGEVTCLHDVARLGHADEVADRIAQAVAGTDSDWYRLLAEHAAALVSQDVARIGAVAERFAAAGAWLLASEAAYSADREASAEGDARGAAAWAIQAEQWRGRCEEVRSPVLVAASAPVPLTRREREVAGLAALGLSRREMAERLYVGVRTVDSHLVRIYAKLGVRNRAELAGVLERTGADSD